MKKIGIIGGAGPYASALMYETMVRASYTLGISLPELFLVHYPFTRGLTLQESTTNKNILVHEIQTCVNKLKDHGVSKAVIACNTMHGLIHHINVEELNLHSLPKLVLQEAKKRRVKRLLVLSTQTTQALRLYEGEGITIIYPPKEMQKVMDDIIDGVLEGKILKQDSQHLSQLIEQTSGQFDAIALACTDLPVLHHHFPIQSKLPILDSIKDAAVQLIRSSL